MTRLPRKSSIGWKYEAIKPSNSQFWRVEGPALAGEILCTEQADAETVAAALNFATNFEAIKRQAERLGDDLEFLKEFK
jgi:hypothetical protein